jgi:hypothetical protein
MYRKIKLWYVFLIIAVVVLGIKEIIDLPYLGAAPFSNKYIKFMAELSMSIQIFAWYLNGVFYSAAGFLGASVSIKKSNQVLKKDADKKSSAS